MMFNFAVSDETTCKIEKKNEKKKDQFNKCSKVRERSSSTTL